MSVLGMLLKEAWGRKGSFLLHALAVALAAGLFVALYTLNAAVEAETTQQTRHLGFTLAIVPAGTDMVNFSANDFADKEMPEAYLERLAKVPGLKINHLSARLVKRIEWEGRTVLLTGARPTVVLGPQKPMGLQDDIPKGTAYLGFELGMALVERDAEGKPVLDARGKPSFPPLKILGETFRVGQWLKKKELKDNIRVNLRLEDAQRLLGLEGRLNEIQAVGCRCKKGDTLAQIRAEIARLLPGVRVEVPDEPRWFVREKMRETMEGYAALVVPILLLVAAAWVGTLAYLNVRQRREEIGLLRAVGAGSLRIAALFLGKAALFGVLGAAAGFALGAIVALAYGPGLTDLARGAVRPAWGLAPWCLAVAPAMAMLASALPALAAVRMDPAEALRQE